jgi:hypothetical protein
MSSQIPEALHHMAKQNFNIATKYKRKQDNFEKNQIHTIKLCKVRI